MDFQQTIAQVTQELADSGFVRETIKKQLQKTIEETVQNMMRSYGPVGEALKKHMESELVLNLDRLSVAGYANTLLPLIRQEIDQTILASALEPIQKMVAKFLTKLEKTSWKLSEIVEEFRKGKEEYHEDDDTFFFEAEELWTDSFMVGFDEETNKSKTSSYGTRSPMTRYDAKYQLYFRKGQLIDFTIDEKRPNFKNVTDLGNFDAFLFNLYVNQVTVEMNSDDVSNDWHPDRDY